MLVSRPKYNFKDQRGEIIDIITRQNINDITLIKSVKGAVRGNHYHKQTTQWNYLLEGKIKLLTQLPGEPVAKTILEPGDLACTVPEERHSMIAIEDSVFIVFTCGPRGGEDYENDTFRLDSPLVEAMEEISNDSCKSTFTER